MENTPDTINCPKCAVTLDITDYPLGAVIINCFLCNHDFCRECNHELDQELLDGTCPIDMPLAADDSYQSRLRMNNVMTELNEKPKNKRGRPKKNKKRGGTRAGAGRKPKVSPENEIDEEHLEGICPTDVLLAADDLKQRQLQKNNVMADFNKTPKNKHGRPKKTPNYGGARPGAGRKSKVRPEKKEKPELWRSKSGCRQTKEN